MALILDYVPGMNLADPLGLTAVRAHPTAGATRVSQQGTIVTTPAGVLRDNHYFGGVRTTLLECATTNSLLQSQALATTWTAAALTSVTNNFAAAPDGTTTATRLIPDGTTTAAHRVSQPVTITSGSFLAFSLFIKTNGYNAVRVQVVDAGTNLLGFVLRFDASTGSFGTNGAVGAGSTFSGAIVTPLANGWYRIGGWGAINNSVTAATVLIDVFDTIADANGNTAWAGNTTSGILLWGAQLEINGALNSPPTSYVATTTVALARDVDAVSMPWTIKTQPMWGYVKFFDFGWSARAAFEPLVMFTDSVIGNPSVKLLPGSGSAGANPSHCMNYANGLPGVAGGKQSAAILTPGANYGDSVELFWQLFGDGSVGLQRAINGAAVTSITDNGAAPDFLDFASHNGGTPTFYLSDGALIGLTRMKLGFGTSLVTTLAQGAAA